MGGGTGTGYSAKCEYKTPLSIKINLCELTHRAIPKERCNEKLCKYRTFETQEEIKERFNDILNISPTEE